MKCLTGKLSLAPKVPTDIQPITSIVWKVNTSLVGEWMEGTSDLFFYPRFASRSQLDESTARLEIEGVTVNDSGVYSVDLNNRVQIGTFVVRVLRGVTKPWIRKAPLTCSHNSEFCVLTCEGSVPEDGEVKYSWWMDGGEWTKQGQKMEVTKNDSKTQNIFCQMENKVSTSQSDAIANPFFKKDRMTTVIAVISAVLVLMVVVALVVFCKRKAIWKCFNRGVAADNAMSRVNGDGGDDDVTSRLNAKETDGKQNL